MIDIEDPSKCRTRSIPDAFRDCNKVGNLFICAVKKNSSKGGNKY